MSEYDIASARESDVATLAGRRYADEASRRLYVRLAESAPRGAWVARDDGTPVGIAFAHENESEWFVSDLFVEPTYRNAGLGWKLLRRALEDAGDRSIAGIVSAQDVGSLAFFLRRGMGLHVPVLRLAGEIPREDDLLSLAAGDYRFETAPIDLRLHGGALDALDREVRGTARSNDHASFSQLASGTVFFLAGEIVAYSYVWPDGRIGPLATASGAYMEQLLAFSLVALRRTFSATWCTGLVPGSNVRLMRAAVRLGLALDDVQVFATDQPQFDLSRYVGFHALAF